LIDFDAVDNNEFKVINQYTIIENNSNKLPDVILFVNGLPLVVMELKNAVDDNATMRSAFKQVQTYKANIPSLFMYNPAVLTPQFRFILPPQSGVLTPHKSGYLEVGIRNPDPL